MMGIEVTPKVEVQPKADLTMADWGSTYRKPCSLRRQKMTKKSSQKLSSSISDISILTEIGSIGAGNATVALSKIIHEPIRIEVPQMHICPPHLVPRIYDKHDTVVTAIFMQLRGNADCDIMLIFEAQEATKIANLMARSAGSRKTRN